MTAAMLPFMALVGLWLLCWAERRHDIAATQADFALCLHCGYNLTRVNLGGVCPQCVTGYNLEEVRACWQRWRPIWSGPKHKNSEALGRKLNHVVLPNAVARDRRRIQICYFLLMVTMFGAGVYLPLHSRYFLALFVANSILAIIGLVTFWFRRRERHLKKDALQADYALCLHCEYDLTGLNKQQYKCPECGTDYDLEYVRACWSNWRTMCRILGICAAVDQDRSNRIRSADTTHNQPGSTLS